MASPPTRLVSFEEFEQLPETPRGFRYELRHGEPVPMPPPNRTHYLVRRRLRRYLEKAVGGAGEVDIEMPFRPLADFEYWQADVAYVSRTRWDQTPSERHLEGAPDLVVEALSKSTKRQDRGIKMDRYARNGVPHYWIIDPVKQTLEVYRSESGTFALVDTVTTPALFRPTQFKGVRIDLEWLFAP